MDVLAFKCECMCAYLSAWVRIVELVFEYVSVFKWAGAYVCVRVKMCVNVYVSESVIQQYVVQDL